MKSIEQIWFSPDNDTLFIVHYNLKTKEFFTEQSTADGIARIAMTMANKTLSPIDLFRFNNSLLDSGFEFIGLV
jgi:hypothetical protein